MANSNLLHNSPYVGIKENDFSQITQTPVGTNIFVAGFAEQGPTDEPTYISSLAEYEEIFGVPTCPATRYSYNSVKQILNSSPGNVLFTKFPWGSSGGAGYSDAYSALVYPVVGVSAQLVDPCDYFRNVDEENCRVNFPELYTAHFVNSSICVGSSNLNCPLNSTDETPGFLYVHDHPTPYNSILTGFKFVVDSDSTVENLRIFQLRPNTSGFNTSYSVVTSLNLSGVFANMDEDQSSLSNDGKRLIVDLSTSIYASNFNITSGLLSGQSVSGIQLSAGDVFGTYSTAGSGVLKYFNANTDVAGSYKTTLTTLSTLSAGLTFSAVTTAVDATTQDFLIQFCTVPVEAGLSCQTITALGLQVPEKDKYTFYPLDGAAQLNDADFYVLGEPISKALNASEYELLQNGQFNWKCGVFENVDPGLDVVNNDVRAGLIVVNDIRAAQGEDFSGYYLALNDNLNINPATDFDALTGVAGYYQEVCPGVSGEWIQVPEDRWNFKISETFNGNRGSLSELVENTAGPRFASKSFNDSLAVSLFKLRPSRLTETINKLDAVLVEKYTGSLNKDKKVFDDFGGPPRSGFIEDAVNSSRKIKMFVNPYLSENNCWNDASGIPQKSVRMFRDKINDVNTGVFANFDAQAALKSYGDKLYGVGSYTGHCRDALYELCQKKDIGNLPLKLERALMNVENPLDYPVDIVIDGGLSNIWATRQAVKAKQDKDNSVDCITDPNICYYYDDKYFVDTDSLSNFSGTNMISTLEQAWTTIANILTNFGQYTRKNAGDAGCYTILDSLRALTVNSKDYKIVNRQKKQTLDPVTGQPLEKYSTFARNIYTPMKNLFENINSSYAEASPNWIKTYDSSSDSYSWYGASAFVAALMARTDSERFPWSPYFASTGKLTNVVDISFNPNLKEQDLISRLNLNAIRRFPEGNLVYNDYTLQKEQTALSTNNIRRGLLWMEKALIASVRQFLGQQNTITTRTRIKNTVTPILQYMKDNSGLYDYKVICDGNNNPPDLIDRGILNLSVYVQPVRNVKYILIDVNIQRSGISLGETL